MMRVKRGYGSDVEYVYDDKMLVAKIERRDDGWRLIKGGRVVGIFPSRAEAIGALDDDGRRS